MQHQSLLRICLSKASRGAILAIALLVTLSPRAVAAASPEALGSTFAASVNQAGEYADQSTGEAASISANGRYVAFESAAANLGEHGSAGVEEAYVKDLDTGEVELASRANGTDGEPANEPGEGTGVENAMISGDGRYVIFTSAASNLVGGLPPTLEPQEHPLHVYRRDLQTGETVLVDRVSGQDGAILDERGARAEGISQDGRYVLFRDGVEDLENPAGSHEPGIKTVYVRDVQAGTTTAVSRASGAGGELANESSRGSAISPDGRYVAFESSATNLVAGMGSNTVSQVYLRDLQSETTMLASKTAGGEPGKGSSEEGLLVGAEGCEVAFSSQASNLSLYESKPVLTPEAYLADLCSTPGSVTLVSREDGEEGAPAGEGNSVIPVPLGASTDGRYVLFSAFSGLTGEAGGTRSHLYVRDLSTGHTTLIDRESGADGEPAKGNPEGAALSANGCRVAFATQASNLGEPAHREIYVRQLGSCLPPAEEHHETTPEGNAGQKGDGQAEGRKTPAAIGGHSASMPTHMTHIRLNRKLVRIWLSGRGKVTVKVARARRNGHRWRWVVIHIITVHAAKAGAVGVTLPRLLPGRYRITIALVGGRSVVRALAVPHRGTG